MNPIERIPMTAAETVRWRETVPVHRPQEEPRETLPSLKDRMARTDGEILTPEQQALKEARGPGNVAATTAVTIGDFLFYGTDPLGFVAYPHELAHAVTAKSLMGARTEIQVDGIDNVRNFLRDPGVDTLKKVITGYDANMDGARGVTRMFPGEETALGRALGPRLSNAIVFAAGQTVLEIPQLAAFAGGFLTRKKHPILGYTLMSCAAVNHAVNTLYPLSAAFMSRPQLYWAAMYGHDFASFAISTGIPPAITAGAFAALLPLEYVGLRAFEKKAEEETRDRLALARLVAGGKISEVRLEKLLESYPGRDELEGAEKSICEILKRPASTLDDATLKELKAAGKELQRQDDRFRKYLIREFRGEIDEEKKQLVPEEKMTLRESAIRFLKDFKEYYRQDKAGAILKAGTLAGTAAVAVAGTARVASVLTSNAMAAAGVGVAAQVLGAVLPAVGVVSAASSLYQGYRTLKDERLPTKEKAFGAALAGFSTLTSASLAFPAAAPILAIGGILGVLGTLAARYLAERFG